MATDLSLLRTTDYGLDEGEAMAKAPEPIVLELATLSREQMGPYLLLGLDKSADKEQIDKHWADRVKWALRQPPQCKASREDVNWAHEILKEIDRRIRSDVTSLNTDTADGVIGQLCSRFGVNGGQPTRAWQPLDKEKSLADYVPSADVPDAGDVRPPWSYRKRRRICPSPRHCSNASLNRIWTPGPSIYPCRIPRYE